MASVLSGFKSYDSATQRRIERALETGARAIERRVKRSLSDEGSGRIYKRRGVTHQASAPGEAPATDMGNLRASYHVSRPSADAREVGTHAGYAPDLENGTRRMAARPHLGPAFEAEAPGIVRDLDDALTP